MQENKNLSVKHYIYGVIYFYRKRKKKGKKKRIFLYKTTGHLNLQS